MNDYEKALLNPFVQEAIQYSRAANSYHAHGEVDKAARLRHHAGTLVRRGLCWEQMLDVTMPLSLRFIETPGGLER